MIRTISPLLVIDDASCHLAGSSSGSTISMEMTLAVANGGRGPTLNAMVSPIFGRRFDRRRHVSVFAPVRIGPTNSPRNQSVLMGNGRALFGPIKGIRTSTERGFGGA